ncbi:hypothetical protein L3X38_005302 [Prunus dulcis]|uniref:Uncharacterized protein n=1 Tax=Prunus dulcis TaxID=3755 RepID=A0AAD5F3X1_PRUDU|nr:hypothetical protein L3X38_005302 [Prunus dulcis]
MAMLNLIPSIYFHTCHHFQDGKGALQKLKQPSKTFWNHCLNHRSICAEAFATSLWYIMQAFVVKKYPAVVFIVFYVTISAAFTLVAVRDASAWGAKAGCGADFYFICRKRIATLSCFGVERFFIVHKGYS